MKTSNDLTVEEQLPPYFSEDRLKSTIKKLELHKLSKEERAAYEIELAKIGSFIGELKNREDKGKIEGKIEEKELTIISMLKEEIFEISVIAKVTRTTKEEVLRIKDKFGL